ncbi:MAG: (S)-ureidoglycine aminohydrolase [Granulosicoccus sp.]|nr:(S)-ureidoglycine aminohydrolase [Granulosicoccus sp.]
MNRNLYVPQGGLPGQHELLTGRAVTTESYAVIPRGVQTDIVTSFLPHWHDTRLWVLARPMSGFSTTFSHYLMEVAAGGGSEKPEPDEMAEGVLFVVDGILELSIAGERHSLATGGYAWLAPGVSWTLRNRSEAPVSFHWLRKRYQGVDGLPVPDSFVTRESDVKPVAMPDTGGAWTTTRFVDPSDLRHDMHVNIVSFAAGASIPFAETHVMEHGLYILEGKAVYRLNQDWVEVEAGDYLWLRAFCPQACYAGGPGQFRYLLYKDVNRHMDLTSR